MDLENSNFALAKVDDENVTLTLDGVPHLAVLRPVSIIAGWKDTLSAARGGLGIDASAANGVPLFTSGAVTFAPMPGAGGGSGDVTGPTGAVADNIAAYGDSTGKVLKDGGKKIADLAALTQVVRYDAAQALTAAQATQARSNIYAAPLDALAYNGMQINGSVTVDQEAAGNRTVTGGAWYYISDMWGAQAGGAVTAIASQNSAGTPPPGFPKYARLFITTAVTTLAANDYGIIENLIEGYRTGRLCWGTASAQPITVGFWVLAPIAGTLAVTIMNAAPNRSYVATVVVTAGWQYKTVTIPGDQAGTWEKTHLRGIRVIFCFGAGSTFRGAADTWQTGTFYGSNLTTNFLGSNGVECAVTGVVVLPGIEAPSAERSPLIMRPFDQELLTCMRYYEKTAGAQAGSYASGGNSHLTWSFGTTKRAIPTFTMGAGSDVNTVLSVTLDFVNVYKASPGGVYLATASIADARL